MGITEPIKYFSIRVLVVDDDEDDVHLIQEYLASSKRESFAVDAVHSAEECLTKLKGGASYDVILMDYRLPDKTGIELFQILKEQLYAIPVVLITSHGDRRLQNEVSQKNFSEYLEKGTFSSELLERTIRLAIEKIKTPDGSWAGIPQDLVTSIRDAVDKQKELYATMNILTNEVKELRVSLTEKIDSQKTELVSALQKSWHGYVKELFRWIKENATIAMIIALFVLVATMVLAFVLRFLEIDVTKLIVK